MYLSLCECDRLQNENVSPNISLMQKALSNNAVVHILIELTDIMNASMHNSFACIVSLYVFLSVLFLTLQVIHHVLCMHVNAIMPLCAVEV
jgi:hypothetical protein